MKKNKKINIHPDDTRHPICPSKNEAINQFYDLDDVLAAEIVEFELLENDIFELFTVLHVSGLKPITTWHYTWSDQSSKLEFKKVVQHQVLK